MKIQIDAKGAGIAAGTYHFYDGECVPRVGDTVFTDHLDELAEILEFPDDDEPWVVENVMWQFGATAKQMGCDVIVWVTHKHLRERLDAFWNAAKAQR